MEESMETKLTLVTTKPCFGLPTSCPNCLPVYLYLKLSSAPFDLFFHSTYPDSDKIPYVESGSYVAYNNEKGGVIECLKEDGIVNFDSDFDTIPEWISMKSVVSSWLSDALLYELWIASDKKCAQTIYLSDLPWPIGPVLYFKQAYAAKKKFGITKENADAVEAEIYKKANLAYSALSTRLGEDSYLFGDRPSSLDALFLGHALITLQALPDTSVLKSKILSYNNLVKYTEKLGTELVGDASAWSSGSLLSSTVASSSGNPSSSASKTGGFSNWSTKPKTKPKKERTEEEKKFRRRAKYFLAAQLISVLLFLSLFGGSDTAEMEFEEEDDSVDYD